MTAPRDPRLYLEDILEAINSIENYVVNFDTLTFKKDRKTQDAVVRNLEIIGEAVKRIPDGVRKTYPDIEWKSAAAMRDFLIHDYPEVDVDAVWHTVTVDLPKLKVGVQKCLENF
jgi:uncharacterized protein with HEPN domain